MMKVGSLTTVILSTAISGYMAVCAPTQVYAAPPTWSGGQGVAIVGASGGIGTMGGNAGTGGLIGTWSMVNETKGMSMNMADPSGKTTFNSDQTFSESGGVKGLFTFNGNTLTLCHPNCVPLTLKTTSANHVELQDPSGDVIHLMR
jgi:hypothetical protein